MADNPPINDPSAQWPEEVRQAYEHLKIPSLYESVLVNEKLSLEVRRQDRELKILSDGIQALSSQLNAIHEIVADQWEEFEEVERPPGDTQELEDGYRGFEARDLKDLEVQLLSDKQAFLEQQSLDTLMEAHDTLHELSKMGKRVAGQLLALIPKKDGLIPREPKWYPLVEELIQGFAESIERSRYKLLSRLEDLDIELIEPQPGEEYNESLHHVLEYVSGGKAGTIDKVIRAGYRQDDQIFRLADVTLYR